MAEQTPPEHSPVLVCGAGPVGLLIALRLGQAGVETLVIERHHELLQTTRAIVHQPVVLHVLQSLGILDRVREQSYLNREGIYWRKVDGTYLGHLPLTNPEEYILLLGQQHMNALLLDEIKKYPSVRVRFNNELAGLEEHNDRVTAMLHNTATSDDYFVTADYVVGTDGANSRVRRSLSIPFDGFSFTEFRMVGADVYHDFSGDMGSLMNFIVDPNDWATVIYTGQDHNGVPGGPGSPLWRVAYTEPTSEPTEPAAFMARAKERIARYAHGRTDYDIKRVEPYTLHQRCARVGHKGRVALAGDALHANNPIGGLGLTTGTLDAHSYGHALVRILKHGEPSTLFGQCAEARRTAWLTTTGPTALRNKLRISSEAAEDVAEREEFFKKLQHDEKFAAELREEMEKMRGESFEINV